MIHAIRRGADYVVRTVYTLYQMTIGCESLTSGSESLPSGLESSSMGSTMGSESSVIGSDSNVCCSYKPQSNGSLPNLIEDCSMYTIATQTLQGYSVSAERTGFHCPTLDVHLDAGMACNFQTKRICISHTHSDHIHNIHTLLRGNKSVVEILCPAESAECLQLLLQTFDDCTYVKKRSRYKVVGLLPNDRVVTGKSSYIKVIQCFHGNVPTRGYIFMNTRAKLKQEYLHLTGKEIATVRRAGVNVSDSLDVAVFAYVCDTSIEVFVENPELLQTQVVMIECTFWSTDMLSRAASTGHIGWTQLEPYVVEHPNIHFILFHRSRRYTLEDVESQLVGRKNVTLWW
jgi:hypothetical protein